MNTSPISLREQEVLHLIAYEHSSKMITDELSISQHTVITHRKNLLCKLAAKNTAGLVRRACEVRLIRMSQVTMTLFIMLLISQQSIAQDEFITIWKTDNAGITNDTQIGIPGVGTYDISWEEVGNPSNNGSVNGASGQYILDLPNKGTYQISISNDILAIFFNDVADKLKILEVTQWGNAKWNSFERAFSGCENLTVTAEDEPDLSSVTNMRGAFLRIASIHSDITSWDVGNVTNMQGLFLNTSQFNQDIGNWDITSVTNMSNMLSITGIDTRTYDDILRGWASQNVQSNVTLGASELTYCNGADAHQELIDDHGWDITDDGQVCLPFITTWQTDNPGTSGSTTIVIPTEGGGYNYDIDFGNNGTIDVSGITGDFTHDFGIAGTYQIAIYGDFPRIYFNNEGDAPKIISIDQWGDIEWS